MSAISLPSSPLASVPAYLAIFSASDSCSRKRSSLGSKSISFRKLRLCRLNPIMSPGSERGIAFQRAGHAMATAAALAELVSLDRDHLDAGLAQRGVGAGVALVGDDDAGLQRDDVVAVIPLFALGSEHVPAGLDDAHLAHAQGPGHHLGQRPLLFLDDEAFGGFAGADRPGPRAVYD